MDRSGFLRPLQRRLWARILFSAAAAVTALSAHAYQHTLHTLTISGTPPASVSAGQSFTFTPTAIDSRTRTLVFAVANPPTWATFSSSTGQLTGTPGTASIGTYANIVIAVSDGRRTATLSPFTVQVLATAGAPAPPPPVIPPPAPPPPVPPPVISGTPPTSVMAGSGYAFQPTASDPAGKLLSFSVQNKPAWASFSIASGQLYGTPSSVQTGTYANIVISASDGTAASALPAFSIAVMSLPVTTGTAVLELTPPTQNSDGSALTDLAGMRVYYGNSTALTQVLDLPGTVATTYTLSNLASGTWYFAATAYTSDGRESSPTTTASKSFP
jgi:Putative Ig domain